MSYTVSLHGEDLRFQALPGQSILEAAQAAGRNFPYGCRNGTCGSCKGRVLHGEVDHCTSADSALTPAERAAGQALFCQARPLSDVEISIREVHAMAELEVRTLPARVQRMERLAHDVMLLALQLPRTEHLHYLAGQYLDVLLPGGRSRAFSIANAPREGMPLELHVRHYPGGLFSGQVFGGMKEKALLRLRGPLGSFFLREDSDRPIIMVAGGTGFAPIKAMVEEALARGIDRPIRLYRGARAKRDLYLPELPWCWAAARPGLEYIPVLSEARAEDAWEGRRGWVHDAVCEDLPGLGGFDVYMSGPPPMCEAARGAFLARGLPPEQLHYDAFEFATS